MLKSKLRWFFYEWVVTFKPYCDIASTFTIPLQTPYIYFLCHWNVSFNWNMPWRGEEAAYSNKPVLHNSSNKAIFTWEAQLVLCSCAALPRSPLSRACFIGGRNGWFDLKRSNYPPHWSDLIVHWRKSESVIEVKLEVIVWGRCWERWNDLIGGCVRLSED